MYFIEFRGYFDFDNKFRIKIQFSAIKKIFKAFNLKQLF